MGLLQLTSIPALLLDGQFRLYACTPAAQKLLRLTTAAMGHSIHDICLSIHIPELGTLLENVTNGKEVPDLEVQDAHGRWYLLRVAPEKVAERNGASLLFVDIDQLKSVERNLRQEQRLTQAVLRSTKALVKVTDQEGRLIQFNRACELMSGFTEAEVLGKHVWDILSPPEDREFVKQTYREMLQAKVSVERETRWVTRGGERRLIAWASTAVSDSHRGVTFLVGIGSDITEHRRVEAALHHTERTLRQGEAQLRMLSAGLLQAQEIERRRISRELHDDISQRLTALAIDVHMMQEGDAAAQSKLPLKLKELSVRLSELSEDLRRTAHELHPMALSQLGLGPALRSYCDEFRRVHRIKLRLVQRDVPANVPAEVAVCVYRVIQEALGNIRKHAGANRVLVSLSGRDSGLKVTIRDDGSGFNLQERKGTGLGLISIEERVRQVNGNVSISSKTGAGTRIDLQIPVSAHESPSETIS